MCFNWYGFFTLYRFLYPAKMRCREKDQFWLKTFHVLNKNFSKKNLVQSVSFFSFLRKNIYSHFTMFLGQSLATNFVVA